MWRAAEAVHAVVYFSPHAPNVYRRIGLAGFWMGYFASRSVALGTPPAPVVTAAFHGFAPRMVERAIPAAWQACDRQAIIDARHELAMAHLRTFSLDADERAAIDDLVAALPAIDVAGRTLGAAHLAMPVPSEPALRLWHAVTVLREYRGDTHVATLVAARLDGVEANVLWQASGLVPPNQREMRGWTEDEWRAGGVRLERRGWLADGELTDDGRAAVRGLDRTTDEATVTGLRGALTRLPAVLPVLVRAAASPSVRGTVPYPNPTGVPAVD